MQKRFRKAYRIRHKRYWYKNKFLWFLVVGVILVISLVYLVWFLPFLQVKEIRVVGDESITEERVVIITKEKISQNILGLRSLSILFVNKSAVEESLRDWFPSINTVSVKKSFPSALTVTIELRKEIISWCKFVEGSGVCVGVDKLGIAFKAASSTDLYITGPEDLLQVSWGDEVIAPELLSNLLDVKNVIELGTVLKEDEVSVVEFRIISEHQVHLVLSKGWAVYINPKENLDWQSTKLKLVLEREIPRGRREELEYIDLRFGDQAFVKYQEE